jgi:hypothetical protein
MVDERLVYAKTAKGVAEVNARSGTLSLTVRRVLIMVDGKRTVGDLTPYAKPGEVGSVIEQLEAQGLVYPAHAGAPTAPPPPQAEIAADEGEERPAITLDTLKRRAVRELSDRLGPDAEVIGIRIEHAKTTDELRQRLQEAERLVAGLLGEAQAQDFLRALRRR